MFVCFCFVFSYCFVLFCFCVVVLLLLLLCFLLLLLFCCGGGGGATVGRCTQKDRFSLDKPGSGYYFQMSMDLSQRMSTTTQLWEFGVGVISSSPEILTEVPEIYFNQHPPTFDWIVFLL